MGKYIIRPVYAPHDVPNCGYMVTITKTGYKFFHISDTMTLDHIKLPPCDWYSIEGNYATETNLDHDIEEKENNGEFTYLKRVKETHCSREEAIEWLKKNMTENSEYEFIHQHQGDNDE